MTADANHKRHVVARVLHFPLVPRPRRPFKFWLALFLAACFAAGLATTLFWPLS